METPTLLSIINSVNLFPSIRTILLSIFEMYSIAFFEKVPVVMNIPFFDLCPCKAPADLCSSGLITTESPLSYRIITNQYTMMIGTVNIENNTF
jgi:hypothetical protein